MVCFHMYMLICDYCFNGVKCLSSCTDQVVTFFTEVSYIVM